ncbi:hypothetical protein M3202_18535 [Alkalihalobacillus oceani]|uniref:RNA polymerase sigma factor SigS n=1 Tax=Halalkalibacter oceani TaxID=1653776 RepID=A0A9X2DVF7_9BACI|nr:hypothetical protein [Halalkalibacter oceani]MCM3716053.1 hypothetical protein [Halalkalibacter oceani]
MSDREIINFENLLQEWKGNIQGIVNKLTPAARLRGLDQDDLYQMACMGLFAAYDELGALEQKEFFQMGNAFIYRYVLKELRVQGNRGFRYPAWLIDLTQKVRRISAQADTDDPIKIADLLNIPIEHARQALNAINQQKTFSSLDVIHRSKEPIVYNQSTIYFGEFIQALTEVEKTCILGKLAGETHALLAKKLGVSPSIINKHLNRAKRKMQDYFMAS